MRKQTGFTLLEIAIVLVIIGLLLGAVLKGQELIQNARVRNLAAMQDGIRVAFFSFQDRFRAWPGDYSQADVNINCTPTCTNGDGNGQITGTEAIATWEHLSKSGFLTGPYTYAATVTAGITNPTSPYDVALQLIYDAVYADAGAPVTRHNLKLGNQIPVGIIAELDRKIDDGNAQTGTFRFSAYTEGGTAPTAANCHTAGVWLATTSEPNCGGASLL